MGWYARTVAAEVTTLIMQQDAMQGRSQETAAEQHLERLSGGLLDARQPLRMSFLPSTALLLTPLIPQPQKGLIKVIALLIPANERMLAASCCDTVMQ